jgi:hypothetical protein
MTPFRAQLYVAGQRVGVVSGAIQRVQNLATVQLVGAFRCPGELADRNLVDFRLVLDSGVAFDATSPETDGDRVQFESCGRIEGDLGTIN